MMGNRRTKIFLKCFLIIISVTFLNNCLKSNGASVSRSAFGASTGTQNSPLSSYCGPGLYLNGGNCDQVGLGYYSPDRDNNRYACQFGVYSDTSNASSCKGCTNKPEHAYSVIYKSWPNQDAGTTNNCPIEKIVNCESGYKVSDNELFCEVNDSAGSGGGNTDGSGSGTGDGSTDGSGSGDDSSDGSGSGTGDGSTDGSTDGSSNGSGSGTGDGSTDGSGSGDDSSDESESGSGDGSTDGSSGGSDSEPPDDSTEGSGDGGSSDCGLTDAPNANDIIYWVNEAFQDILNRYPEGEGLQYWACETLNAPLTKRELRERIAYANPDMKEPENEFSESKSNLYYIFSLTGRGEPSASDYQKWSQDLAWRNSTAPHGKYTLLQIMQNQNNLLDQEFPKSSGGPDLPDSITVNKGELELIIGNSSQNKLETKSLLLILQNDHNLVLYRKNSDGTQTALWSSNTYNVSSVYKAHFTADGWLGLYDINGDFATRADGTTFIVGYIYEPCEYYDPYYPSYYPYCEPTFLTSETLTLGEDFKMVMESDSGEVTFSTPNPN